MEERAMASENGSSVIRSLCLRCGKTWPVDALACSCGTEFREEVATVIFLEPSRSRLNFYRATRTKIAGPFMRECYAGVVTFQRRTETFARNKG
jgi:hypothetical protein